MIFKCLAAHPQYSLPVEALNVIVELSKSLPVEVNNSTIELHLPVDSQYSLPVEALNLIAKSKSIKSFFMEIIFFLSAFSNNFCFKVLGKNASIRSKLPTDLNIEFYLPVEAKEKLAIILFCGFSFLCFTTVFVDTQLWITKHPRKRFQNFRQSCVLLTDWIQIHQSQPLV